MATKRCSREELIRMADEVDSYSSVFSQAAQGKSESKLDLSRFNAALLTHSVAENKLPAEVFQCSYGL